MLNRLKSLEMHGYKTFADQTRFEFPGAITAIVGPNGSGKSNIADAMRWVLGEQSYSLLRGKKTDDMIFYGSEQRPRASMASATMTFDNSDGWLPIDFSEVAVTRRAYRDGQNEYLLNGQKVRLKEITELLAQSGLAERTYTIIGQGLVDTALALKPDERRKLFEEAAGIGLYRSRKEEALHRLDTTRRNLERVQDILAELKPRLSSLERQARKAQEYEQVRADLRLLLRDWYGYHWHRVQKEVKRAQSSLAVQEARLVEARKAMGEVSTVIATKRAALQANRSELNDWYARNAGLNNQLQELNRQMAVLDEREASLDVQIKNQQSTLTQLEAELKAFQEAVEAGETEKEKIGQELADARREQDTARQAYDQKKAEKDGVESELRSLREQLVEVETGRVKITARRSEYEDRLAALQINLDRILEQAETARDALKNLEERKAVSEKELGELDGKVLQQRNEVEKNQKQLAAIQERLRSAELKATELENEQARTNMQLDLLRQAEQTLTGYAEGARRLVEAARAGRLQGIRHTLASILDVEPKYENAVAGALAEFVDLVILDNGKQAARAISLIEEGDDQRAALLPLDWINPTPERKIAASAGILGMVADFVHCPKEYEPVVRAILGGIPVVKDGDSARAFLKNQDPTARAVTLAGELYCANGPILAGKGGRGGIIGRGHQIQDLTRRKEKLSKDLEQAKTQVGKIKLEMTANQEEGQELAARLAKFELEFKQAQETHRGIENEWNQQVQRDEWLSSQKGQLTDQVETAKKEIESAGLEVDSLEGKAGELTRQVTVTNQALAALDLTELESQAAHWDKQVAVATLGFDESEKRLVERRQAQQRAENAHLAGEQHLAELLKNQSDAVTTRTTDQQERDDLKAKIAENQVQIDTLEQSLASVEKSLEEIQQSDSTVQQELTQAERFHSQAQIDLTRQRDALDALRRRIEDDFGLVAFEFADNVSGQTPLPFDGIVEQLKPREMLPEDIEENINRQKGMLRRMGAVNLEAQEEYDAVRERHDFLIAQTEDLRKADADLVAVIAELDELMKKAFQTTFSKVAEEFHHTFARLFPGGHARLTLLDEEDVIESGIEIEARLPGRREQGLSLLSGGERSLTASALVFALLRVSPTPFCVLDEVDAMLDEANVNRFSELLSELSANTQFVVITHNRNTVQVAGVIYGITIGRDSASRVISLKMDEVTEEYVK